MRSGSASCCGCRRRAERQARRSEIPRSTRRRRLRIVGGGSTVYPYIWDLHGCKISTGCATRSGELSTTRSGCAPVCPQIGIPRSPRGRPTPPVHSPGAVGGPGGRGSRMRCPFCRHPDSRVIDSREVEDGQAIRRRRSCPECSRRFTHGGGRAAVGGQAQRGHRAVQPEQGDRRRHPRLPGPAGRSGRHRAARPAGRGGGARQGPGRGAQPGGRAGHPRPAARPGRGRLPALRIGVPLVHLRRRLRRRDPVARAPTAPSGPATAHRPTGRRPRTRPRARRKTRPDRHPGRCGQIRPGRPDRPNRPIRRPVALSGWADTIEPGSSRTHRRSDRPHSVGARAPPASTAPASPEGRHEGKEHP